MIKALDGGYIIPILKILKLYIEQNLKDKVIIQQKKFSQKKTSENSKRLEDESWDKALKKVKDLTHKIKSPPETEPQPRSEGKESAKKSNGSKTTIEKEEGHSETRFTHLAENLDRRIVRAQVVSCLFPNYQRVPMEANEISKDIVRAFEKENTELKKKFMDEPTVKQKQEEVVELTEKKSEEKLTYISNVEDWLNWKPPTISSVNDPS
ncbi:hypothetical protein O181_013747 [Austropuccinia psidii MF-1]|uniref:Uncharacterized protein n=1 Tax=Austropuccinia psidii MF-1 TaxID=1389203 RepID=A0A9Q3C0A8_9BASI|nr:hypothetical protein [Austropuccinia psidii MF-1]